MVAGGGKKKCVEGSDDLEAEASKSSHGYRLQQAPMTAHHIFDSSHGEVRSKLSSPRRGDCYTQLCLVRNPDSPHCAPAVCSYAEW